MRGNLEDGERKIAECNAEWFRLWDIILSKTKGRWERGYNFDPPHTSPLHYFGWFFLCNCFTLVNIIPHVALSCIKLHLSAASNSRWFHVTRVLLTQMVFSASEYIASILVTLIAAPFQPRVITLPHNSFGNSSSAALPAVDRFTIVKCIFNSTFIVAVCCEGVQILLTSPHNASAESSPLVP